jgi:hypothetical protein
MPENSRFSIAPKELQDSYLVKLLIKTNNLYHDFMEQKDRILEEGLSNNGNAAKLGTTIGGYRDGLITLVNEILHALPATGSSLKSESGSLKSESGSLETEEMAEKILINSLAVLQAIRIDINSTIEEALTINEENTIEAMKEQIMRFYIQYFAKLETKLTLKDLSSGKALENAGDFDGIAFSMAILLDNLTPDEITRSIIVNDEIDQNVAESFLCGLLINIITNPVSLSRTTANLPRQYHGLRDRLAEKLFDLLPPGKYKNIVNNAFYSAHKDQVNHAYLYIEDIVKTRAKEDKVTALQQELGLVDDQGKILIPFLADKQDVDGRNAYIATLARIISEQPGKLSGQNTAELLNHQNSILYDMIKMISSGNKKSSLDIADITAIQDVEKFKAFLTNLKTSIQANCTNDRDKLIKNKLFLKALDLIDIKRDFVGYNNQLQILKNGLNTEIATISTNITIHNLTQDLVTNKRDDVEDIIDLINNTAEELEVKQEIVQRLFNRYPAFIQEFNNPQISNLTTIAGQISLVLAGSREKLNTQELSSVTKKLSRLITYYDVPKFKNFVRFLTVEHAKLINSMERQATIYPSLLNKELAKEYRILSDTIPANPEDDEVLYILRYITAQDIKPEDKDELLDWTQEIKWTAENFPKLLESAPLKDAPLEKHNQERNLAIFLMDVSRILRDPNIPQKHKDNLELRLGHIYNHNKTSSIGRAITHYLPGTLLQDRQRYLNAMQKISERAAKSTRSQPEKTKAEHVTFSDPIITEMGPTSTTSPTSPTSPTSTAAKSAPKTQPQKKVVNAAAENATQTAEEKQPWYKKYQTALSCIGLALLVATATSLIYFFVAWPIIPVLAIGGAIGAICIGGAAYSGYTTWSEEGKVQETSNTTGVPAAEKEARRDTQKPSTGVSKTSSVSSSAVIAQQGMAA